PAWSPAPRKWLKRRPAADSLWGHLTEKLFSFTTTTMERWRPPDFSEESMRKHRLKAPAGVVTDYFRLFVNRRAYTLQSERPHPESGRYYYYRPTAKQTGEGLSLTPDTRRT